MNDMHIVGGPARFLDQIVYRDSGNEKDLLDRSGVGPMASSLNTAVLKWWHDQLENRIDSTEHKYPSICYLPDGDQAALIYRDKIQPDPDKSQPGWDKDQPDRSSSFAHVLIGPRTVLTTEYALGSWRWQWEGAITPEHEIKRGGLPRVEEFAFTKAAAEEWEKLAARTDKSSELEQLIKMVFERGKDPAKADGLAEFVIFIDENSHDLPVRLLSSMITRIDSDFVKGGFSTCEVKCDEIRVGLPRFVFATEIKRTQHNIKRIQVDLQKGGLVYDLSTAEENDQRIEERRRAREALGNGGDSGGGVSISDQPRDHAETQTPANGGGGESPPPEAPTDPRSDDGWRGTKEDWDRNKIKPTPHESAQTSRGKHSRGSQANAESQLQYAVPGADGATAAGIALIKSLSSVRYRDISKLTASLLEWASAQSEPSVIRSIRAHLLAESFYPAYLNNLRSDANFLELDQLYGALVICAFPPDLGVSDVEAEVDRLLAERDVPYQLAAKIRMIAYPDQIAPAELVFTAGKNHLARLGFSGVAPPGAASAAGSPDQARPFSPQVVIPVAACVLFLVILAVLVIGAAW